eukprot:167290-Amphidinium_carterae.1
MADMVSPFVNIFKIATLRLVKTAWKLLSTICNSQCQEKSICTTCDSLQLHSPNNPLPILVKQTLPWQGTFGLCWTTRQTSGANKSKRTTFVYHSATTSTQRASYWEALEFFSSEVF